MPPAISEDEASASEIDMPIRPVTSATGKKKTGRGKSKQVVEPEEEIKEDIKEDAPEEEDREDLQVESESDGPDEDDVYVVEKVCGHVLDDETGKFRFQVKWEGYEKKSDRTWEPEENLETASEAVEAYLSAHGGREALIEEFQSTKQGNKKKRARKSAAVENSEARTESKRIKSTPNSSTPPLSSQAAEFVLPNGNWEDEVVGIDACEGNEGKVVVYLKWKDGSKTQHPLATVYKRCPQRMLKFYEEHLVFRRTDTDA